MVNNYNVLTAADVRCAVANTRKMANWMMCCMVSERSHCSGEMQYIINHSVGNININTQFSHQFLLRIWFSGLLSLCICLFRQEHLVSYLEWCCFYIHFYSLVNIFPPLAGTLIWCPFNVLALIKFRLTFYSCVQPFSC